MNKATLRVQARLKISYWNCQGIFEKKAELQLFLTEYNIDVMLLNETFLKPGRKINIPNYKTYRNDRLVQPGGGTAILIKKNIPHSELPTPAQISFETNGITVHTTKQKINIWSTYCSPNAALDPTHIRPFL